MNTTTSNNKVSHPCQHCGKICYGKQCKECHLKMIAIRDAICCDCSNSFPALRKDGTKRVRCYDCQEIYNATFIADCRTCGDKFHKKNKDGREFNECLPCYKRKFVKCTDCDNTTLVDYPMCKSCYATKKESKKERTPPHRQQKTKEYELRKCATSDCPKMTTYKNCSDCNNNYMSVANQYMLSVCQYDGCGLRYKGYYKFCEEHA